MLKYFLIFNVNLFNSIANWTNFFPVLVSLGCCDVNLLVAIVINRSRAVNIWKQN